MTEDTIAAAGVYDPAALSEWLRRWDGGEKIRTLSCEAGISWQKLHGLLTRQRTSPRPAFYDAGEHSKPLDGVFGQVVFDPATGRQQPMYDNPLAVAPEPARSLLDKYRPRRLSEVVGQDGVIEALRSWLRNRHSIALFFEGETGTGKTSTALALAAELGCAVEKDEFGGVYQIASGEQTSDTVRSLRHQLSHIPFFGSGWKVCIVNEADRMHPQAETVWLDVLESLPARTLIVFTTNNPERLTRRFKDRCVGLHFNSDPQRLDSAMRDLANRIWRTEVEGAEGKPSADAPQELDGVIEDGHVSFRRLVQAIGRKLQTRRAQR